MGVRVYRASRRCVRRSVYPVSLSPQFLDEIRARTSLSTLVMRSVPLKRAGREWRACCPFHDEKGPSFHVNDEKAFYHCFGCGAHGDAISWLVEHDGMQFMDAVKELAQAAGLDMPAMDPRQAERDREFEAMREIMARAARWFTMEKPGSDTAMSYLEQRDIMPLVALDFDIGYAPRGRGVPRLLEHLNDVNIDMLVKLGLVKRKDDGETYDAFRGRIMFPIHDTRGRVIGFGGRILGQGEPKYLNSPDTPLFDKGRTLFNYHRAAPAARKEGRLVIVEGYMDTIALCRAGVTEVVAPNGTALTEAQMMSAWRLADEPIVCMDGDKAGLAAMARAAIKALPLLEPGKSLRFVAPPAGKDPDDVLREGGLDAVQSMLASPRPLADVLWAHERNAHPADTPEQVAGLKARMPAHVRSIKNADVREAYGQDILRRFATTFGVTPQGTGATPQGPQIRSTSTERPPFSRKPAYVPPSAAQRQIRNVGIGQEIERAILIGLLHFPDVMGLDTKKVFKNERAARLVSTLCDHAMINGVQTEEDLDAMLDGTPLEQEVNTMTAGGSLPFSYGKPVISDAKRPAARDDLLATIASLTKP